MFNKPSINLIVAKTKTNVIGFNNTIPWKLSKDMQYFKDITFNHTVIMGRKTYESIGKCLPGRINIVISRNKDLMLNGCTVLSSLEKAIEQARVYNKDIFIIGGSQLYKDAIHFVEYMYITDINKISSGDAFFPEFNKEDWKEISRVANIENGITFDFIKYKRK